MRYRCQVDGQVYEINIERQGELSIAMVEGLQVPFQVLDSQPGELSLLVEGRPLRLYWAADGDKKWISLRGCTYLVEKPASANRRTRSERPGEHIAHAPMPARLRSVMVQVGDHVEKGQTLLVLEAMKMEIRIQAQHAGRVARLLAQEGQTVQKDDPLLELQERSAEEDAR
jgi:acetyl/propionyl-CoA carboxylase alpha subunit